ncbi:hypothetical protein DPMN_086590 [Dreissena polymorpha]|uniref:Uncharacterized protein n=1 Tax=Dreissena polymorpha TaxID=45954 RepID=A0A9D4KS56_DREPO|nr:hypothetical protein DPMN_086590 [Dreissena polymorpha]
MSLEQNEKCPPPGDNVFQATGTIFELVQELIGTNLLTKFHDDWTINMASRVLTRKNATPPWQPCFPANGTIFELIQDIIGTNLVIKFHDDRTINVASKQYIKLIQDIIVTNLLPKFHEDRKINVASIVLTRKKMPRPLAAMKNAPPLGSHVFQANITIFELIQDINEANLLTKVHEDWTMNVACRVLTRKNAPPPGGHVFQATKTIFILFHEDQTINVASRVHVFQANLTIFELNQDIIETNLLTKFHDDWTINVASRVLTRQMLTPHNGRHTKGDHKSSP